MGSGKRKRRQFDRAFKLEAVKLSQQAGRGLAEVARNLGINETVLRRWRRSGRHAVVSSGEQPRCLTRALLGKEQSGTVRAMASVRITAKRQATLPAALCEELGVGPGDNLVAERRVIRHETVWVLRPRRPDWSWLGAARSYAEGKSHRWRDIRRGIAKGWAANARP